MTYSVQLLAEELSLGPEDLRDIFSAFFEDAEPLLIESAAALQAGDKQLFSRKMHAIKGASLNLRMDDLGNMAATAEKNSELSLPELENMLQAIRIELAKMEGQVNAFYATRV